ncbi:unnamed protein product [Ilex paraguariensis]|uniref:Uncharacterized protein n=1 Tax=Ilex paraguariensis TaxID=185542 RepID=A0ABC8SNA3_9AQUA
MAETAFLDILFKELDLLLEGYDCLKSWSSHNELRLMRTIIKKLAAKHNDHSEVKVLGIKKHANIVKLLGFITNDTKAILIRVIQYLKALVTAAQVQEFGGWDTPIVEEKAMVRLELGNCSHIGNSSRADDFMIEEETKVPVEPLVEGQKNPQVSSIVGMPGISSGFLQKHVEETLAESYLDILLWTLDELRVLISDQQYQIQPLYKELKLLMTFVKGLAEKHFEYNEVKTVVKNIYDVKDKASDVITSFVPGVYDSREKLICVKDVISHSEDVYDVRKKLMTLIEDLKAFKEEALQICVETYGIKFEQVPQSGECSSRADPLVAEETTAVNLHFGRSCSVGNSERSYPIMREEEMAVGFDEEMVVGLFFMESSLYM